MDFIRTLILTDSKLVITHLRRISSCLISDEEGCVARRIVLLWDSIEIHYQEELGSSMSFQRVSTGIIIISRIVMEETVSVWPLSFTGISFLLGFLTWLWCRVIRILAKAHFVNPTCFQLCPKRWPLKESFCFDQILSLVECAMLGFRALVVLNGLETTRKTAGATAVVYTW